MREAEKYLDVIMRDERNRIVSETPTIYEDHRIERLYEFDDGAVVKYEWQDSSPYEFNHRFTLVKLPSPNPAKLKMAVIGIINY